MTMTTASSITNMPKSGCRQMRMSGNSRGTLMCRKLDSPSSRRSMARAAQRAKQRMRKALNSSEGLYGEAAETEPTVRAVDFVVEEGKAEEDGGDEEAALRIAAPVADGDAEEKHDAEPDADDEEEQLFFRTGRSVPPAKASRGR